jgi:hypothetical protein
VRNGVSWFWAWLMVASGITAYAIADAIDTRQRENEVWKAIGDMNLAWCRDNDKDFSRRMEQKDINDIMFGIIKDQQKQIWDLQARLDALDRPVRPIGGPPVRLPGDRP